jgi:hypothetical protein
MTGNRMPVLWLTGPAGVGKSAVAWQLAFSWPEPGDPLAGKPPAYLRMVGSRAAMQAQALEEAGMTAVRVDTDGLSVAQAAQAITAATGWPGNGR